MPTRPGVARLERPHVPAVGVVKRNRAQGPATLAARGDCVRSEARGRVAVDRAEALEPRRAPGRRRRGVPLAARPLSRRRAGFRRHLPRQAVRSRPHLGGPLHEPRRARAQGRHAAARPTSRSRPTRTPGCGCASGELSGIDAFQQRLLAVRGNLDYAIAFEGLFRLPGGRPPLLQIHDVPVGRHRISTLTMGEGPTCCSSTASAARAPRCFETAAALSRRYRVHAPDLPGFGSSSKPALGGYNARWFAEIMLGLMDELGIDGAHIVGNSMGGRIAIEMGLMAPERVRALGLLCPAVAWVQRGLHPVVRLLRPEFGLLPHGFRRRRWPRSSGASSTTATSIDPAVGDLMVDEFRRIYQTGRRAVRVPRLGSQHLSRGAVRSPRLLPAARRAAAARAVHLGQPRPAGPGGLRPPRPRVAAERRAGHARAMRPRSPGRARRGDQRAAAASSSPAPSSADRRRRLGPPADGDAEAA